MFTVLITVKADWTIPNSRKSYDSSLRLVQDLTTISFPTSVCWQRSDLSPIPGALPPLLCNGGTVHRNFQECFSCVFEDIIRGRLIWKMRPTWKFRFGGIHRQNYIFQKLLRVRISFESPSVKRWSRSPSNLVTRLHIEKNSSPHPDGRGKLSLWNS